MSPPRKGKGGKMGGEGKRASLVGYFFNIHYSTPCSQGIRVAQHILIEYFSCCPALLLAVGLRLLIFVVEDFRLLAVLLDAYACASEIVLTVTKALTETTKLYL